MSYEAPINPVMPESEPAPIDPAVQAAIEADNDLRLAEHEHDLAQIREDEGRRAIEDGLHNIAYTAELHRLAHDPSQLTGEHGLSGYDEMEHRARAAGHQAVENHRSRVAEIRAEADAEYERVRDFERAYEADKWDDVVIALDKMAAYAEKTDDWTEFDTHHEKLRSVEKATYMRHFDAQHPEDPEPTPAPVSPEGGEAPEPHAPLVPEAAAAERADDEEPDPEPTPAPARPLTRLFENDPEDDSAEDRHAPFRRPVPSWAAPEEEGRPQPSPFGEASFGEPREPRERRRLPSWDDVFEQPAPSPAPREGALDEAEPLPFSPLEDTSKVGIPEPQPYSAPAVEERPISFADRWGGTTDAAGRVAGWRPQWYKDWRNKAAEKKRRKAEQEEHLEGAEHVADMDERDALEAQALDEVRRTPVHVDEGELALRGTSRRRDRNRRDLDRMLEEL